MFHSPEQEAMVGVDDEDDDESVDIFFVLYIIPMYTRCKYAMFVSA